MKEFNNRQIADQHAEYITGQALRKYAAEKVKKYVPDLKTVFDGAAGSGQLEQYLNAEKIVAVEIQKQAADTLLENFPNSEVHNTSFFLFDEYKEYDASLINPPFSLKFKDQTGEEIEAIQSKFPWKKSGVLDDIFLLKSLNFTKRYGFYILFPGVGYRKSEKKMRELVGNRLLELNYIEGGFEDTTIPVIFIVLDKEKTESTYTSEIYDCKTQTVKVKETFEVDIEHWEVAREIEEKEEIDIVKLEAEIKANNKKILKSIKALDKFIDEEVKPLVYGGEDSEQISIF